MAPLSTERLSAFSHLKNMPNLKEVARVLGGLTNTREHRGKTIRLGTFDRAISPGDTELIPEHFPNRAASNDPVRNSIVMFLSAAARSPQGIDYLDHFLAEGIDNMYISMPQILRMFSDWTFPNQRNWPLDHKQLSFFSHSRANAVAQIIMFLQWQSHLADRFEDRERTSPIKMVSVALARNSYLTSEKYRPIGLWTNHEVPIIENGFILGAVMDQLMPRRTSAFSTDAWYLVTGIRYENATRTFGIDVNNIDPSPEAERSFVMPVKNVDRVRLWKLPNPRVEAAQTH